MAEEERKVDPMGGKGSVAGGLKKRRKQQAKTLCEMGGDKTYDMTTGACKKKGGPAP